MDPLSDITLTGEYFRRPVSLPKLTKQYELSNAKKETMSTVIGNERITALLLERQMLYQEEQKKGAKQPNQDALLVSQPGDWWHVGVADGVGGLPQGEIASTQGLRFIHHQFQKYLFPELLKQATPQEVRAAIEGLLRRASRHINRIETEDDKSPNVSGRRPKQVAGRFGATTVVGAFSFTEGKVVVYSVGDSGIALVPADMRRPILYSKPHTTFEQALSGEQDDRRTALLADFYVTKNGSECRDLLTSALGGGEKRPRKVFVGIVDVKPGDTLFLYSDGLLKTVGKQSDTDLTLIHDLRLREYARADRLLEHFSDPRAELKQLSDKRFRAKHHGPEQLVDDTSVVRVEIGYELTQPATEDHAKATRPASQSIAEVPKQLSA